MSGSSYLKGLKKAQLTEAAQASSLPGYSQLKVDDLRDALSSHLTRNATTYASSDNEYLSGYYQRGETRSPMKKDNYYAQKISEVLSGKSDEEAGPVVKKQRRKTTTSPTEESSSSAIVPTQTPARDILRRASINIGSPDPKQLADAVDRTARQYSNKYVVEPSQRLIKQLRIAESTDFLRDWASSPLAIAVLAVSLEGWQLSPAILPFKHFTDISYSTSKQPIYVPDLFALLETKFWAPFILWIATSVLFPLLVAYFINFPLKAQTAHNYSTRQATAKASTENQFDPFVYFIAKGLISYLVYTERFLFFGAVSNWTLTTVKQGVKGGHISILTTSTIGAAFSLYEAVLKR